MIGDVRGTFACLLAFGEPKDKCEGFKVDEREKYLFLVNIIPFQGKLFCFCFS